ncbi:MAG: hypothetical protein M3362_24935 [Acidobacteriota bacterium]|nr:hypothetical protein [Acidobacteriota bacterium]
MSRMIPRTSEQTEFWKDMKYSFHCYKNEQKIDELLSRIWGQLITSIEQGQKDGQKRQGKFAAKLGGLASLLGIGEVGGEYGFERSKDTSTNKISTLTYDNKIQILLTYFVENENFRIINVYDGVEHFPPNTDSSNFLLWSVKPLRVAETEFVGHISGIYKPVRLVPSGGSASEALDEIMWRKTSLWEFQSVEKSAFKASIPWIPAHFQFVSQSSLAAIHQNLSAGLRLQALGIIRRNGDTFTCDPISMRMHY